MYRSALIASLLAASLSAARSDAQPTPEPKDGKVVIPLTLTPAAVRQPVANFYLVPEVRDMKPGNRVQGYLKCFMEQDVFFNSENTKKREKWLEMTLADLPPDVRQQASVNDGLMYNPPYSRLMVFIDEASRYNHIDWNEWFGIRKDGAYFLIPELQKLRQLAWVIRLRMRGEIKNREFDKAIESAKTLFGMAKAAEQHPTLIGYLVGVAIATVAVSTLEEMVEQPGCPNLYWSFTDLSSPVLNMRLSLGGERVFLTAQFKDLLSPSRALSQKEIDKFLKEIEELVGMSDGKPAGGGVEAFMNSPKTRYHLAASDPQRLEAARKSLVEYGIPAETAKSYLPLQVVMARDLIQYEIIRDELFKWIRLPYWQSVPGLNDEEARLKKARADYVLGPLLVPAVRSVKRAETRLDQRVAYLRVIEAIRLYAHEHGGALPPNLDAIKLPLPLDPVTGKPFEYSVKDGVATLHGENAQPESPATNRYYELRIRK